MRAFDPLQRLHFLFADSMKYFITGATGFIGMKLARELAMDGHEIHLLVRSPEKAKSLILPGVSIFEGDISDIRSIEKAMLGCTHVFHLAAYAKPTAKDQDIFWETNVEGTRKVLDTALKLGIERVVFTSTGGTFGVTGPNSDVTETSQRPKVFFTKYAETKRQAEILCQEFIRKGLDVITVYPTRVYGPGVVNESNAVTKIMGDYLKGKWRLIPGNGKTFGNYVFVGDVVNGLILAMEKSRKSEDYILGGTNVTFNEFFQTIKNASGKNFMLFRVPYPILWIAAALMTIFGSLTRRPAMITPGWVKRYLQHRRLSSKKAEKELGYSITSLKVGFAKTFNWIKQQSNGK